MGKGIKVHPKKLENLKSKFVAFLKDVSLKSKYEKPYGYPSRFYGHRATLQWGELPFSEAITSTQKLCPKVSTTQIANSLGNLMLKIFEDQVVGEDGSDDYELESIAEVLDLSSIDVDISQMVNSLEKLVRRQVVFVPIEGLKMKVASLKIGSVTLYSRSNASDLDQELKDVEKQYDLNPATFKTDLRNIHCYTRVEAVGDNEFVRDEAVRRTKEAINILNLYISSSKRHPKLRSINISRLIVHRALPDDEHQNSDVRFLESYPNQIPFEIDLVNEEQWVQMDLKTMNSCFQSQGNTDIGKRIQRATNWYGKAVDTDSPEEKFVNLAIALESLLIGDEGKGPFVTTGSINQKIGERVAFLLGKNFDKRKAREEEAKKLYDLRSKIVHGGESVTKENLAKMDKLVKQVILVFLNHKFNNWSAFLEWIAHERYDKAAS